MRAVRLLPPGGFPDQGCRLPGVAESPGRSTSSSVPVCRRFTVRRLGRGSRGLESESQSQTWPKRGARCRSALRRGPAERRSSRRVEAQRTMSLGVRRLGPLVGSVAPLPARRRARERRRCGSSSPAGPRRGSSPRRFQVVLSSPTSLRRPAFRRS